MTSAPLICTWTGDAMRPLSRYVKACDAEFVVGLNYRVDLIEERSAKSHSHYFAELKNVWDSLPDAIAERFPTVEHMRKFALCKTGFCNDATIACSSGAEARRTALVVANLDEFAVAEIDGAIVRVRTAKSQSLKAMGKQAFQESKDAVLNYCYGLVGVDPVEMQDRRRRAA